MSIFVRDKDGNRKKIAGSGLPGKSAYQYAVEGGFKGTEQEFAALQGQISNPNLLDNWYFLDPVNQRGQTEYTGGGYSIDRWMGDRYEDVPLLAVDNGFITIKLGTVWFGQFIDAGNINDWLGKTYTLSVLLANGEFYSGQATPVSTEEDYATAFRYKDGGECYLQFLWGEDRFLFCLWAKDGATLQNDLSFKAAKLELGPVQTLAHQDASGNWVLNDPPPNKALELVKCQRYQQFLPAGTTGKISAENELALWGPLPTEMRANPTAVIMSNPCFGAPHNATVEIKNPTITFQQAYTCGVLAVSIVGEFQSSIAVGNIVDFRSPNAILLDANI